MANIMISFVSSSCSVGIQLHRSHGHLWKSWCHPMRMRSFIASNLMNSWDEGVVLVRIWSVQVWWLSTGKQLPLFGWLRRPFHGLQSEELERVFQLCVFSRSVTLQGGKQSLETIILLFAYKAWNSKKHPERSNWNWLRMILWQANSQVKFPENFFLLRGNHECLAWKVANLFSVADVCLPAKVRIHHTYLWLLWCILATSVPQGAPCERFRHVPVSHPILRVCEPGIWGMQATLQHQVVEAVLWRFQLHVRVCDLGTV